MTTQHHADRASWRRRNPAEFLAEVDVAVVGFGIVGIGHAVAALDAGKTVAIIDRDRRPIGASIRNFGHACVTGQVGELADLAYTARRRWLELADRVGFWAAETGGLALARSARERNILEELADDRGERVRMISADEASRTLGTDGPPDLKAGALLRDDLRVDPREAVPKIAAWLADQPGTTVWPNTSFVGSEDDVVYTSRGPLRAEKTYLCTGHDLDYVAPELAEECAILRCALQMTLVEDPGVRIEPAVLSGTSMLRYEAFSQTEAARGLREELTERSPDLLDIDANLMMTQRPDGTLIIGDSHEVRSTQEPFLEESTTGTLLAHAERLLGLGPGGLRPRQRWQGVYATSRDRAYLQRDLSEHLSACVVTTGVGMTIGLGLAERSMR